MTLRLGDGTAGRGIYQFRSGETPRLQRRCYTDRRRERKSRRSLCESRAIDGVQNPWPFVVNPRVSSRNAFFFFSTGLIYFRSAPFVPFALGANDTGRDDTKSGRRRKYRIFFCYCLFPYVSDIAFSNSQRFSDTNAVRRVHNNIIMAVVVRARSKKYTSADRKLDPVSYL